jgi:hypothetical protein
MARIYMAFPSPVSPPLSAQIALCGSRGTEPNIPGLTDSDVAVSPPADGGEASYRVVGIVGWDVSGWETLKTGPIHRGNPM